MSVYKHIRKEWLKSLTKTQRNQFKRYVQDIHDGMLEAYAESIRLNKAALRNSGYFMPIDETGACLRIEITCEKDY